ncbi:dipeptidyl aminopeptidase/acylaminoacyl peptidase [Catenulispora sp. GAS73]|uniref:S9 family peptidase n=1 Tax=Catenulispora sp. GAS73 TaxID=3156269 RepID=UPI00351143E1
MTMKRADTVAEFFDRVEGRDGDLDNAVELAVSPDGRAVAFTALVTAKGEAEPVRRIAVLDLDSGALVGGLDTAPEGSAPCWSPDGRRLAWIAGGPDREIVVGSSALVVEARYAVPGFPESVAWRPDGGALSVCSAEPGASRSDVHGSGYLPGDASLPGWLPEVSGADPPSGARRVWLVELAGSEATCVSPSGTTVWQAAWAGSGSVVCVASEGPTESDWYGAELALLDVASGRLRSVLRPEAQVGIPAANPSGTLVSAVVGWMSDRGLYAGRLTVVDVATGGVTEFGDDITAQIWTDDDHVLFAALHGLDTVIGEYTVSSGACRTLWRTSQTCGDLLPDLAASGGTTALVTHGYGQPRAVATLSADGAAERRLSLAHAGSRYLAASGGTSEPVAWQGPDGRTIEGILVTPSGPGPHPLVVHLHGGPVWAWRDEWSMHFPLTPLLAAHGYAVLHPNMRGGIGRGQDFVRAGLHDMGGADATDILAGVDALVAAGRVDPGRIGVTGNSYGGFMSAWLVATSDRFAAAVIRSPVTDWVSQHFASNLPGFDRLCLTGDPSDPASDYRLRSPLYLAAQVRTPVLLVAGAKDLATPPEQAAMFHRALVEHGRESTLVIYPEEGHGVRQRPAVIDLGVRMLDFFDRHLADD